MINYEIKYSKRKTVAIYINPDGNVEVRCPKRTRKSDIEGFVSQKQEWIEKKLSELNNQSKIILRAGETSPYLGDGYPILHTDGEEGFYNRAFYIRKSEDEQYVYDALKRIYIQKSKEIIPLRVHKYGEIMGLCASKVRITSAKTRWGSCSAKNSLNFTWKLIMADLDTIDYVVVHELAHIKEKNHSEKFWNLVGLYKPDYKDSKNKLRDLAVRIRCDGWEK